MSTTLKGAPAPKPWEPTDDQYVQFLQQMAVYGESLRFQELDRREAFFRCAQYDHQKFDWEGRSADQYETISPEAVTTSNGSGPAIGATDGLMARDKRPTAPTNLARTVTKRYTGLLFSEQRKPKVRIDQDPDTEAFLEAVREAAKFWPTMRAARDLGGATGSVVITVGCRNGKFSYEVHNAKNVTPVWEDRRTLRLAGVLIMWKYGKEENVYDKDGKFATTRIVDYLYRRIITGHVDVIFEEVRVEDAPNTAWTPMAGQVVTHSLGRFPGVWVQNSAESQDIDGDADCEGAWQTIDTNDRLIAQMNMGTLRNLDPTLVTKVDPQEMGKIGNDAIRKGSENALEVGSKGDAKYIEITGAGIELGRALSGDHKQTVCDITGMVLIDDQDMAAAQSAKAIEFRFAPMIERADDFRAQYGEAVIELMRITEFIARTFLSTVIQLVTPDGPREGRFRFDLPPRKVDGKFMDQKLGTGGYITLEWGAYFSPTEDDNSKKIQNATAANAAGFVDQVTAARAVAPIYGVQDVATTVALANDEADVKTSRMMGGFGGGVPADGYRAAGGGGLP